MGWLQCADLSVPILKILFCIGFPVGNCHRKILFCIGFHILDLAGFISFLWFFDCYSTFHLWFVFAMQLTWFIPLLHTPIVEYFPPCWTNVWHEIPMVKCYAHVLRSKPEYLQERWLAQARAGRTEISCGWRTLFSEHMSGCFQVANNHGINHCIILESCSGSQSIS